MNEPEREHRAYKTLWDRIVKGDPKKEEKLELRMLQIFHAMAMAVIPIVIITAVLLSPTGSTILAPTCGLVRVITFYFLSVISFVLNYKWSNVSRWLRKMNWFNPIPTDMIDLKRRLYTDVQMSHYFKVGYCYLAPIFYAFLIARDGCWMPAAPLVIVSGTALVLTFPTRRKHAKWLAEQIQAEQEQLEKEKDEGDNPSVNIIFENQSKYDLTIYLNDYNLGKFSPGGQITDILPITLTKLHIEAKNPQGETTFSKTMTREQMQRIESRVYKVVIPSSEND
jgi:hypothetical protein